MTIEQLRRKLRLPFNQNPTLQQLKEHGIELRRPERAPSAPPPPPSRH